MAEEAVVTRTEPRREARVTFPDGMVFAAPLGTPLEAYFKRWQQDCDRCNTAIAAIVDDRLRELTYPVERDVWAEPVTPGDRDGGRIYRRSLVFLLTTAAAELYPVVQVRVDHALPSGAFFCTLRGRAPFSQDELDQLEAHMRAIVAADDPIRRAKVSLAEAIRLFEARQDDDKLRLLQNRQKDYLQLYTLRGNSDYFYGYMVPSTGYLDTFKLRLDRKSVV